MIIYLYLLWIACFITLVVYILHKMFYKTKASTSRSNSTTVTSNSDGIRSQQFYIYAIDRPDANSPPPAHLDLPPKYEDVVKDPKYLRREVL
ncbi:hypothetical protein ACKWTF_000871 [Chironomus riparius]